MSTTKTRRTCIAGQKHADRVLRDCLPKRLQGNYAGTGNTITSVNEK